MSDVTSSWRLGSGGCYRTHQISTGCSNDLESGRREKGDGRGDKENGRDEGERRNRREMRRNDEDGGGGSNAKGVGDLQKGRKE